MYEEELQAGSLRPQMIIRLPHTMKAPFKGEDFVVVSVKYPTLSYLEVELRDKRDKVITKKFHTSRSVLCWYVDLAPYYCPHTQSDSCSCLIDYT